MDIREIAGGATGAVDPDLLRQCEAVHRQLRPHLPDDYVGAMQAIFDGGAGMAVVLAGERPIALAVWRAYRNTSAGHRFYVDDLVTDEAARSTGAGGTLMAWLEQRARDLGCAVFSLDSGTARTRAHRFYFREGLAIGAFNFSKSLKKQP